MNVSIRDPRFTAVVGEAVEFECLGDRFLFTEGPAWDARAQRLIFSDIPGDGNPGIMVLKRGTQDLHLRGVARLAVGMVDHFAEFFPELSKVVEFIGGQQAGGDGDVEVIGKCLCGPGLIPGEDLDPHAEAAQLRDRLDGIGA